MLTDKSIFQVLNFFGAESAGYHRTPLVSLNQMVMEIPRLITAPYMPSEPTCNEVCCFLINARTATTRHSEASWAREIGLGSARFDWWDTVRSTLPNLVTTRRSWADWGHP